MLTERHPLHDGPSGRTALRRSPMAVLRRVRPDRAAARNGRATAVRHGDHVPAPSPVPELEALRRIPGLETGPTAELITLGSLSGRCHLAAGQVAVRPGQAPKHVLLVVSGTLEVRYADEEPVQVGAGEMVGLRAFRAGEGHREEAVVVVDAEVLAVRVDVVDRLLELPSVDRLLRRSTLPRATTSPARERPPRSW